MPRQLAGAPLSLSGSFVSSLAMMLVELLIGGSQTLLAAHAPFAAMPDVELVAASPAERLVVDGVERLREPRAFGADEVAPAAAVLEMGVARRR